MRSQIYHELREEKGGGEQGDAIEATIQRQDLLDPQDQSLWGIVIPLVRAGKFIDQSRQAADSGRYKSQFLLSLVTKRGGRM